MNIATWNVNSLRVRLPQLLDWLAARQPDVVALQETKLEDGRFPVQALGAAGYQALFSGQKAYNGVALLTRAAVQPPPAEVITDLPGFADPQRRVLAATVGGVRVVNLYAVNGQAIGSPAYAYKLRWLEAVAHFLARELGRYPRLVVVGDFNIAPEDRDVHDPEVWRDQILCSAPERAALRRLLDLGLTDVFRLFEQPARSFTWWDYRQGSFRRNQGLRIDLILASAALAAVCRGCDIDRTPRRWPRPSDHAPVLASFDV